MENIIEIKNLSKIFDGKDKALDDVSFNIRKGEVHGLVGKNGAGKSTLIKILTGSILSTSGKIIIKGKEVRFKSIAESLENGIKAVYQDYQVCENLNVWQNIFLYEKEKQLRFVNKKQKIKECEDFLKKFSLDLRPTDIVTNLSSAGKQLVCIAKAIASKDIENIKILVLDEPTASLSLNEKNTLFNTIKHFKKLGITTIFVSHILKDVIDISDRITIIRDSKYIDTLEGDITEEVVIEKMVGKKVYDYTQNYEKCETNKEIIRCENLLTDRISIEELNIKENEITGFVGLEGCGASELMRVIAGVNKKKEGKIFIEDKELNIKNIFEAIRNKIIYISGDKKECLMENFSILNNLITLKIKNFVRSGFIKTNAIKKYVNSQVEDFGIKIGKVEDNINSLSGGNQRKVILSKFLAVQPKLLMMDDNTKGVDINAKYELYNFLKRFRCNGVGIIFYSTEIEEVLLVAEVIHVMLNGRIIKTIDLRKTSVDTHELTLMITSGIKEKIN